jgi:DNA-binding GntR family transcriptional regulator
VAEVLRKALLEGRFQPGEELSDAALAGELHVSRGPVREALLVLAEEGLVVLNHHRGFAVPRLGRKDLEQIAQARRPLEVLTLELAREHVRPPDLERLKELKDQLLTAFRTAGMRVCATPDMAFHSLIWELSGNPWLQAALRRLSLPYFFYVGVFSLGRRDHSLELMDAIHQRYIDYLARSTSEPATECVDLHLSLGSPEA